MQRRDTIGSNEATTFRALTFIVLRACLQLEEYAVQTAFNEAI